MSQIKEGFGERLREERNRLGQSQKDFAEQAGVKRVTQYLYENEDNSPTHRYLVAVSELGVDLHYLIFGQRNTPNGLRLRPKVLREIYQFVDEIARDQKGRPLPVDTRADFLLILCSAYSGLSEETINPAEMKRLLGHTS
ncbi:MAG: helix-turn-helix transcriptional regulator [Candidatus Thiodiazotropha endolucinida]